MRVIIDIKFGSDFQKSVYKDLMKFTVNAIKDVMERKHKKNKVTITVEEK